MHGAGVKRREAMRRFQRAVKQAGWPRNRGGKTPVRLIWTVYGVDPAEAKAKIDAEIAFQNNVTERWKADMGSDVKLAKLIRPVTLIALMVMFMATMVADSMDGWPFNVKDSYVSLLEILMLTAFGAYFAGRTIEKAKK